MKKVKVSFPLFPLLIVMVFITACFGQDQPILLNHDEISSQAPSANTIAAAQIGENILTIFEDSQGNIWFGTTGKGVARFDGKTLKYFTTQDGLCGNTVANIAEDNDGILWFGTHSDMCRLYPKASGKAAFIPFEKTGEVPLLGWGWKKVQTDPVGNIWVNTHQGIFQYQNGTFSEFKVPISKAEGPGFCNTPGNVSMDLVDSKGNLWFGTDADGAYKYDGSTFTHYSMEDGLPSQSVTNILEDKQGNIWFSCIRSLDPGPGVGGLCKFDGHTFTRFPEMKGLENQNIQTIYADKAGNIWIGATGVGLYRYDPAAAGNSFTLFKEPSGLDLTKGVYIEGLQSMLEDSKGRFWMGFSGGLFRLEGAEMVNITQEGPWN